ncbi:unnamed protein product [Effrenium voratum]|nr:unnamed protein product [Effrenium voratum]
MWHLWHWVQPLRRQPLLEAMPEASDERPLLEETWLQVFTFLEVPELCRAGALCSKFRALAADEELWRRLCKRRWAGKQWMPLDLFRNGDFRGLRLSVPELRSLLKRRDVDIAGATEKSELIGALEASTRLRGAECTLSIPGKWKRSYACAELDSKRSNITTEEVSHFRWHLVYHGRSSSMGFRHFQKNGTFVSPHFGEIGWCLEDQGRLFTLQGMEPLQEIDKPPAEDAQAEDILPGKCRCTEIQPPGRNQTEQSSNNKAQWQCSPHSRPATTAREGSNDVEIAFEESPALEPLQNSRAQVLRLDTGNAPLSQRLPAAVTAAHSICARSALEEDKEGFVRSTGSTSSKMDWNRLLRRTQAALLRLRHTSRWSVALL